MHNMNLLPETETVRRQTRLLLLITIGATISSAFWITTTTLTHQELKTQLQASIDLTESRIKPIPPLNARINDLRTQLEQRDPINLYIDTLPTRTNHIQSNLEQALSAFSSDDRPDITIERMHLAPHPTTPTLELSGRAASLESISARFSSLNARGIIIDNPNTNTEADGTTTFTLTTPLTRTPHDPTTHLTPNQRNALLNLTPTHTRTSNDTHDGILDAGIDDLSDIDLTGPPDTSDEPISDALDAIRDARTLERDLLQDLEGDQP